MTSEAQSLTDELHRELGRVRTALAEFMDWGRSVYFPPEEVVARYEAALEITDKIADFFLLEVARASDQRPQLRAA